MQSSALAQESSRRALGAADRVVSRCGCRLVAGGSNHDGLIARGQGLSRPTPKYGETFSPSRAVCLRVCILYARDLCMGLWRALGAWHRRGTALRRAPLAGRPPLPGRGAGKQASRDLESSRRGGGVSFAVEIEASARREAKETDRSRTTTVCQNHVVYMVV